MKRNLCLGVSIGLLTARIAVLAAGTAATDEIVILNPFLVNAEEESGYRATNSLLGSRLNTPLRDLAGPISIFTRDFLDDIGATDIAGIIRYDLNIEEDYGDASAGGAGAEFNGFTDGLRAFRMRGLRSSTSTDGFRTGVGGNDTYNMENVGSTRGPNSILFGTGAPGGMLNFRTKSANTVRDSNNIELKLGDFETHRAVFDINRVLIKDRLAVRLMGLYDNEGNSQPYQFLRKNSATLAVNYKFGRDSNITLSYEHTRLAGVSGRKWGPLDNITKFLAALSSGDVVWNPARERYETRDGAAVGASSGVGNVATRTLLVYGPTLGEPMLWEGATSTANRTTLATNASVFTGSVVPITPEWISPLGKVTATGASEYGKIDYHVFTATFNHKLAEHWYVELAANQSGRNSIATLAGDPAIAADLNYRLPGGALNPYFYGNGYYFMQTPSFLRQKLFNDNVTFRATTSYDLNLGSRWGWHRIAAMVERNINNYRRDRLREVWEGRPFGGTAAAAQNQIARRRYIRIDAPWEDYTTGFPEDPLSSESYRSSFANIGMLNSSAVPTNALDFDDEIITDSQLLVVQSYFFRRRLVTTFGFRHDQVDTWGPRKLLDATTQIFRLATEADQPFFDSSKLKWYDEASVGGWRRSLGAVYHVTNQISLTANTSNGIELPDRNRTVLPTEQVPLPYRGNSVDVGVSFSLLNDRIVGSVKAFETKFLGEQANGQVTTAFVQPNNDVMASFDYYFRKAGLTTLSAGDPIQSIDELRTVYFSQAASYLSDRRSKGQEFELVANPTPNWAIRLGYSRTESTKTNVLNEGVPWWAERVALWQDLDKIYTTRTGRPTIFNQPYVNTSDVVQNRSVADRIADSDKELAEIRLAEEQGYGNRKHKFNAWTRYRFSDGRLKGLTVGGGVRYQSRNIAGVDLLNNTPLYGNDRLLFDGMLQYRTRGFFGRFGADSTVTWQLNVENLLNDRTIYISKAALDDITRTRYVRRGFREDPRTIALTMRMDF